MDVGQLMAGADAHKESGTGAGAGGKRVIKKVTQWDAGGTPGQVAFTVAGKTAIIRLASLSEEVLARATAHGLSQKVGDAAASAKTDGEKFAAIAGMIDQLLDGVWNTGRSTGGGTDLAHAIARVKRVDLEAAQAAVARADDETLKAWAKHPLVVQALADIRKERAAERAAASGASADDIELGDGFGD